MTLSATHLNGCVVEQQDQMVVGLHEPVPCRRREMSAIELVRHATAEHVQPDIFGVAPGPWALVGTGAMGRWAYQPVEVEQPRALGVQNDGHWALRVAASKYWALRMVAGNYCALLLSGFVVFTGEINHVRRGMGHDGSRSGDHCLGSRDANPRDDLAVLAGEIDHVLLAALHAGSRGSNGWR